MRFLLDTNAFSEIVKPRPDPDLVGWLRSVDEDDLFVSVLTVGELKRGAMRLAPGARRSAIEAAVVQLITDYHGRILDVDLGVIHVWSELSEQYRRGGIQVGFVDELLAATALCGDRTLVTRNRRHFEQSGCSVLSPWSA